MTIAGVSPLALTLWDFFFKFSFPLPIAFGHVIILIRSIHFFVLFLLSDWRMDTRTVLQGLLIRTWDAVVGARQLLLVGTSKERRCSSAGLLELHLAQLRLPEVIWRKKERSNLRCFTVYCLMTFIQFMTLLFCQFLLILLLIDLISYCRWFFPASASTNFYSPMVAIQLDLTDLPPNSDFVTLMCQVTWILRPQIMVNILLLYLWPEFYFQSTLYEQRSFFVTPPRAFWYLFFSFILSIWKLSLVFQVMASNGRLLAADATWATISVADLVKEQIAKKAQEGKQSLFC